MPLSVDIFNKKILSNQSNFGTFGLALSSDLRTVERRSYLTYSSGNYNVEQGRNVELDFSTGGATGVNVTITLPRQDTNDNAQNGDDLLINLGAIGINSSVTIRQYLYIGSLPYQGTFVNIVTFLANTSGLIKLQLNNYIWSLTQSAPNLFAPPQIGLITPNTGTFTILSATDTVHSNNYLSGGVNLLDIFTGGGSDSQTLSWNSSAYELSISNGNTVSLASLSSTGGGTGREDVNTLVIENSATWIGTSTAVQSNSANWDSTYTTVQSNSSNWNATSPAIGIHIPQPVLKWSRLNQVLPNLYVSYTPTLTSTWLSPQTEVWVFVYKKPKKKSWLNGGNESWGGLKYVSGYVHPVDTNKWAANAGKPLYAGDPGGNVFHTEFSFTLSGLQPAPYQQVPLTAFNPLEFYKKYTTGLPVSATDFPFVWNGSDYNIYSPRMPGRRSGIFGKNLTTHYEFRFAVPNPDTSSKYPKLFGPPAYLKVRPKFTNNDEQPVPRGSTGSQIRFMSYATNYK